MGWESAVKSSPLFAAKKPVFETPKAQRVNDPANLGQTTNNMKHAQGEALQFLETANQRNRQQNLQDTRFLLREGVGDRIAIDSNAKRYELAGSGRQPGQIGGYNANDGNQASAEWAKAIFEKNTGDNTARMSDVRKAENEQALGKMNTDAQKFAASEGTRGTQAMANAQLGAAKAAADAAKYGASEQARAGIFGSLFGSISNANQGGFRYW